MEIDEPVARKRHAPWVEKYRPEKVDDVSHQDEVVRTLKTAIQLGTIPHLMFYGPPGTGKTTTILAVARALYGPELYRSRLLELNASDDRGIKVIRDKVKNFAQGSVGTHKTAGYPCPRFKLIVLDEADTMTPDAQSALRRIMETYARVTRFCLICNYVTRIIEPLASRCAKFRFKTLSADSMVARLTHIADSEGVRLEDNAMSTIMRTCGGDMRKAVTYLQSSHQLSGGEIVTSDMVLDISGQVPENIMIPLWQSLEGNTFDRMHRAACDIVSLGYPMSALLQQLHEDVIVHSKLLDIDKALICEKIAQADNCIVDGASELLQLCDVVAFIMRRMKKIDNAADEPMAH